MHTQTHSYPHLCIQMHLIYVYMSTDTNARTYTYTQACMQTHVGSHMQTNTDDNEHILAYGHHT